MIKAVKTTKLLLIAFLLTASSAYAFDDSFLANSEPVTLKTSAVVKDNRVVLGDIFNGVGDKADKAVAISPAPGGQISLDARQLYRIAKALNLDWRPLSLQSSITISRASYVIKREDVEQKVTEILKEEGIETDSEIVFNNRDVEIHTPIDLIAEIVIKDLTFDNNRRRFAAVADVVAGETSFGSTRISGQIFPTTLVPVLNNTVSAGTVIKETDLVLETIRADQLRANTIVHQNQIVGMEAKRNLRKGNQVQVSDIDKPVLVSRNQLVSIIISTPLMNLTARGQAREGGSEGDLIKVVNTRSNKIIQARIIGEATVTVDAL